MEFVFLSFYNFQLIMLSGARVDLPASPMAERFILRRDTQYGALPLYLPLVTFVHPQAIDPRRDVISVVQSHLFVVCTCACFFVGPVYLLDHLL
jgi:hypothetical protein